MKVKRINKKVIKMTSKMLLKITINKNKKSKFGIINLLIRDKNQEVPKDRIIKEKVGAKTKISHRIKSEKIHLKVVEKVELIIGKTLMS